MSRHFAEVSIVDSQNPFVLDDFSEPQPDILLLRPELRHSKELPRPEDILLVVEVSDTTYLYDAGDKLRASARSGIPESWIANIAEHCVEIYRRSEGEAYAERFRRASGDTLSPLAFPDRVVAVAEILP